MRRRRCKLRPPTAGGEAPCLTRRNFRLPLKERMQIPRVHMPELDPRVRAHNFEEVNQGLAASGAVD